MRLPDEAIIAVIAQLRSAHPSAGIPAVRRALQEIHQCSCGTDRLRKLLAEARGITGGKGELVAEIKTADQDLVALRQERDAAIARAERSEDRERAHQVMWAAQIDQLRLALNRQTQATSPVQKVGSPQWLDLYKELRDARARIAELEAALANRPSQ